MRTESGTNFGTDDEVELALKESALLFLKDENLDKQLFRVPLGVKYSVSDRDSVIEELKSQGKWQDKNPIGNMSKNTGIENLSNYNYENVDNIPQSLPLNFGPETLDKLKSSPDFIAAYGSISAFSNQDDRKQWLDRLNNVYHAAVPEMSKYEYPNGPVTAFGYSIDGVLLIGINSSKTVDKPFMDEIYKIFDSKASLLGIKEVPVVFVYQDNPVPTDITGEPAVRETSNLSKSNNESISNIRNSSGNKSGKTNSVPGFGLLGGLACLYGGWKLRKK